MRKETLDLVLKATPRRATCSAPRGSPASWRRSAPTASSRFVIRFRSSKVEIDINPEHALPGFLVQATVKVTGQDRRRDGGADRGLDRVPDDLRHGQSGRARHAHRRHPSTEKSGGKSGRWRAEGRRLRWPFRCRLPRAACGAVLADAQPAAGGDRAARPTPLAACSPTISPRYAPSRPPRFPPWMAMRFAPAMSRRAPATLKVIGEVAAGHPFEGKVGPGEAARIFTGGVMPTAPTLS